MRAYYKIEAITTIYRDGDTYQTLEDNDHDPVSLMDIADTEYSNIVALVGAVELRRADIERELTERAHELRCEHGGDYLCWSCKLTVFGRAYNDYSCPMYFVRAAKMGLDDADEFWSDPV